MVYYMIGYASAIVISGILGMVLDSKYKVKSPVMYWLIGLIGGTIGGALWLLTLQAGKG